MRILIEEDGVRIYYNKQAATLWAEVSKYDEFMDIEWNQCSIYEEFVTDLLATLVKNLVKRNDELYNEVKDLEEAVWNDEDS